MEELARGEDVCIWTLKMVSDQYLFSGDSEGGVKVWDPNHGTLLKHFKDLKADINTLAVNHKFGIVYATGVDSRVLSIQFNTETEQWVSLGLFRGQSHDIKSLVLLQPNELISAGETTDICVYKLQDGTLGDQFGKQHAKPKLRHVPPFPFQSPCSLAGNLLVLLNGNGRQLDIYSTESHQLLVELQKKGDFLIRDFSVHGSLIAYTDCQDTQIFRFNAETFELTKVSRIVCK